ncbi:MAG: domain S-box protein [Marmoricola sp.]|jgi:PAS domain S-box-containing protein|nr:domain S-box protein [Marmoricola sp.]MCW2821981.1 domain S-box protein [Marmoricola sp.]
MVWNVTTLAAAEERWRLTIDNAPVGIALVSLEGKFVRVNETLCQILGYSTQQLEERTFQDLTHPDDLGADLHLLEQLVVGEIARYQLRKRYVHSDGHAIWTNLSVALVRNGRGKPLHFVSHIADLTEELAAAERIEGINRELNEQKARLERSNADLEAFAMLASHDLQAPLATIRGFMELLASEYGDELDPNAIEWISRATQAAERMSELVSSLLDFSRVSGAGPLTREQVSVTELVMDVRQDLDQQISEAGAVVLVADDTPPVLAQGDRLRQVLQNLIQNTIKYRSPDRPPHCLVEVEARDSDWLITVTDNAAGIPEEHRESVFSMFTRVNGTEPGHGIGLAACRQIVERHGGRIWAEENPEGGSRFLFTVPR